MVEKSELNEEFYAKIFPGTTITTEEELNWVENEGEGVKQTHDYVINEDIESVRSEGPLVVFKERWKHKERRVRRSSAAGHLRSVII